MRTFIGLLLGGLVALGASGISGSAALAQSSPKAQSLPKGAPTTGVEAETGSKPGAAGKDDGKSSLEAEKDGGATPMGCPYQNRKLELIS